MSELNPKRAAELARDIYDVHDNDAFKLFLAKKIFSQSALSQTKLNAHVGGRIFNNAIDGFGLCAMGSSEMFNGDAFFIFRGTTTANNGADFLTDARIGVQQSTTGMSVHIGFNETFKSMLADIREFLNKNPITGTIHCIGHSLGGAVATLAADWLKSQTGKIVKLYTFGQPRVGFTFYSLKVTTKLGIENIHRVFHSTDPVPMVPIYPYVHSPVPGNGHLIESSQLVMSGDAHKMSNYVKSVGRVGWHGLKSSPAIFNMEKAVEEWLTSKIRPDSEHPRTWEWLDAALIYVLKKIGYSFITALNTTVIGLHSLADRIAWILLKGIDLANQVSEWVKRLITKIMQVLGVPALVEGQSLTKAFLSNLLARLIRTAYRLARKAMQTIH